MKHFSLIANPIAHSKSPLMQNAVLLNMDIDGIYTRFLLENKDELSKKFLSLGLNGANVSLPFKNEALIQSDISSQNAQNIGSANILILKNNKIYAYNSDFLGFLFALKQKIDLSSIKNAIVLGAGGTTKALVYALKTIEISCVIANRSDKNFKDFDCECVLYDELKDENFDLVINATSASLKNELPCDEKILKKIFTNSIFAYEVGYFHSPFLELFKKKNEEKIAKNERFFDDGAWMLCYQGAASLMYFLNEFSGDEREFLNDEKLTRRLQNIANIMYQHAF